MKGYLMIICVLVMFVICIGCVGMTNQTNSNIDLNNEPSVLQFNRVASTFDITVIYYDNYGVTCFVMDNYNGGGISCLSGSYGKGV